MSVPTEGEVFAILMEHLRLAQEACATLSHLAAANDRKATARGWLACSEQFKTTQRVVIEIAKGKLH